MRHAAEIRRQRDAFTFTKRIVRKMDSRPVWIDPTASSYLLNAVLRGESLREAGAVSFFATFIFSKEKRGDGKGASDETSATRSCTGSSSRPRVRGPDLAVLDLPRQKRSASNLASTRLTNRRRISSPLVPR